MKKNKGGIRITGGEGREREELKRRLRITKAKRDKLIGRRESVLLQLRNIEKAVDQYEAEVIEIEEKLGG